MNSYLQATHWEAVLPYRAPGLWTQKATRLAWRCDEGCRLQELRGESHLTWHCGAQDNRTGYMVHWQVHPARPTPHGIRKTLPTVPPEIPPSWSRSGLEPRFALQVAWLMVAMLCYGRAYYDGWSILVFPCPDRGSISGHRCFSCCGQTDGLHYGKIQRWSQP